MTGERSVDVAAAPGTLHVTLLGGFSVRVGSRAVPGSWRLPAVFLNGSGGINSVINGTGAGVSSGHGGPSDVVSYP